MLNWIIKYRVYLAVAAIMAIAAFMRLWQLGSLPPGLHPDEAANGLDIFKIMEGDLRPFYTTNGGRESLFFFLQAIGVAIFGNTIEALRVAPAISGTLAVGAVYLWLSSWFSRRVGLIGAFLMAVTPWAVIISRDGFRAGMVMLIIPLTLWLMTKAFRTRQLHWYVLAGISFAAGFYTYISYRAFPAALLAMALFVVIWKRDWLKGQVRGIAALVVASVITLLPLGIYAVQHPADIAGRPGGVSFTNPDLNHGNPVGTLIDTTIKTALMFNFQGDENYRHNVGGAPAFNIFVGVMFVLGIFVCLVRIKRIEYLGVLLVFGALLLPEIVTAEGIPHFLRAIGALPAAVAFAAIGIVYMLRQWEVVFPLNKAARLSGTVVTVLLLALTGYFGYVQYFVAWGSSPKAYDAYAEDSVALAKYFNTTEFTGQRYVLAGGYHMQTAEYLTHNKAQYQLSSLKEVAAMPPSTDPIEFATFSGDKDEVVKALEAKFPNGKVSPHYSTFNGKELFVIYRTTT